MKKSCNFVSFSIFSFATWIVRIAPELAELFNFYCFRAIQTSAWPLWSRRAAGELASRPVLRAPRCVVDQWQEGIPVLRPITTWR